MNNQKHTPEPWEHQYEDEGDYVPNICNVETKESIFRRDFDQGFLQLDLANAERIVACVNALAGIEDVEGFMEGIKEYLDTIATKPGENYSTDTKGWQNDRLLAKKALALFPTKEPKDETP